MKRLYLLAALLLLALPSAAFAQSTCTQINAVPVNISQPGKYCLAKDVTVALTTGNAINIMANDVTLDCDGRTLKNTSTINTNASTGIFVRDRNNVVVRNCRVVGGWNIGIDVFQNNALPNKNYYIQLRDNYVAGPLWQGIRAYGSAIEITGNNVYDIGGKLNQYAVGIRVGGSTAGFRLHIVRDNTVVGTNSPYSAAYGIFSDGSLSSAFLDNGIAGTTPADGFIGYGMYVLGTFNRVSDNHVTGVGAPEEWGVWTTDATTSCFDNYLRTTNWTQNCDSEYGNY